MKTRLLILLGFICTLKLVKPECDLERRKDDVDFPDLAKYVAESYIMGVEYSVPGAKQTDYYTEYYDNIFKKGRIDTHINGENRKYLYYAETKEAWVIENRKCVLKNESLTPDFFKDFMTDWDHFTGTEWPSTIGPSAMFKNAYDTWKNRNKDDKKRMAYMGLSDKNIRGEPAVFWRRCLDGDGYADYFFAGDNVENPFDTDAYDRVITPLRVVFHGISGLESGLSTQSYDILSFHHLIPAGVEPFELPVGLNCQRSSLVDGPQLPTFTDQSIFLSAEVVYQRYSTKDGYELMSSYYSTLMFALDLDIKHLAYYYSDWDTSKPDDDEKEVKPPNYVIYDMMHEYKYNFNYGTGKCEVSRSKEFNPEYKLPEGGLSIQIDDPYILFPNNELNYLTRGKIRGLDVNIFEAEIEGYPLDKRVSISKVIATHAYLKSNEISENTVEVSKAPVQIQLRMYRDENPQIEEVLTFNIFGFTTRIPTVFKQYLFDITRCFKNDDDYSYLTIGFEVQPNYMPQMPTKLSEIEENVLNQITLKSELNPVRIPKIMSDIKQNYVYVTLLILGKPPLQLDFTTPETDKSIVVKNEAEDTQFANFDTCANTCLETRSDCWGFSICGSTCYFGSSENKNVEVKKDCSLVRRYNGSVIQSKDLQIRQIVGQIEAEEFRTMVTLDSGERVELMATIAQVTDPAEDDSLFENMGNQLNPRMTVLKAATKLKKEVEVKNMGKLRYDECQRLCLDFKDCETISYCLLGSKCVLSAKYGSDLTSKDMEADPMCVLLTRKYADHFDRTPGVFVKVSGGTEIEANTVEDCARACVRASSFKCLSFDHCSGESKNGCTLYTTHYLNPKARKEVEEKNPSCGHYSRKFSNDFRRKDQTRILGSKVPPITNLTLEECAKTCIEYGQGACYGYDFCQDKTLFATSCVLFDEDPSRLTSTYSPICTNYARDGAEYAPHPYTTAYAGGIGFLCFMVGAIVGAIVVFVIAYIRVNRH